MSHNSAHLAGKLNDWSEYFLGAQWYHWYPKANGIAASIIYSYVATSSIRLRALQPLTVCRQDLGYGNTASPIGK